ncbi:hypothetical protein AAMO2058_001179800 [Amorphochlora amoebiformis]
MIVGVLLAYATGIILSAVAEQEGQARWDVMSPLGLDHERPRGKTQYTYRYPYNKTFYSPFDEVPGSQLIRPPRYVTMPRAVQFPKSTIENHRPSEAWREAAETASAEEEKKATQKDITGKIPKIAKVIKYHSSAFGPPLRISPKLSEGPEFRKQVEEDEEDSQKSQENSQKSQENSQKSTEDSQKSPETQTPQLDTDYDLGGYKPLGSDDFVRSEMSPTDKVPSLVDGKTGREIPFRPPVPPWIMEYKDNAAGGEDEIKRVEASEEADEKDTTSKK